MTNTAIFQKDSNLWPYKMTTIIVKNSDKKSKNRNKNIKPKIINVFSICLFVNYYLNTIRKIVYHYLNISLSSFLVKKPDRANPIHFFHSVRLKTKNKTEVGKNFSRCIKLLGLISSAKQLYMINSYWPMLLILYFIKSKLVWKMLLLIMCLHKNRKDLIKE